MRPRISIRGFVRPSVGRSVRPSVGPSVGPLRLCKNRGFRPFSATTRSYTESSARQTWFESLHYYSCRSICLFVHLSIHMCHMINIRRDTVWTHRCPVGLVCGIKSSSVSITWLPKITMSMYKCIKHSSAPLKHILRDRLIAMISSAWLHFIIVNCTVK